MDVEIPPTLYWLAVVATAVLGTARLTRLLVFDSYPPVAWLRAQWDRATGDGPWSQLVHCGFCAAPWIAVATLAWGYFTDLHWSWWVFYGWLAISYLAAAFVAWDEPPD
jgi:hypothetical protein